MEYLNICGNSNAVRIIPSDYSLKDFEEVEEAVKEFAGQYDIQCFGVDRKDNTYRLEVTAENYNRLSTALETTLAHTVATNSILSNTARISFNQALQDSKIKIEIGEEIISTASVVYGGDGITVGPTSSCVGLSVCIGGTYGGDSALLTAGHGYTGLWDKTVRLNETTIGNVTHMNYSQDSSSYSLGEYGVIKLNSSATTTSKVRNGNSTVTISGYYSSLPVGTNIMKYGTSYGYATGSVLLVNQSTSHNGSTIGSGGGYYVSGLTVSSVRNSSSTVPIGPGDSGGPIYIYYNSQYQIHGNIVCGQVVSSSSLTAYNVYSSPIYYAIYAGFSPKYG